MANATAAENCFINQSCDDLNVVEFSNIDNSLLMSLLEDSQVEDGDDETLRIVIQSLEQEIMNQDSCLETYNSDGYPEDYRFSDVLQLESCSTSPDHHLDFEWIDMDMAYSSPSDDMTSYFIGHFTDKIENMVELGGVGDYSQDCSGVPMEEDYYTGLWQ
ncbi:hypothetical protein Pfo_014197 [Paulownia fortunei]|nr:hypothetical protein Pfo_014197 [Paulownia fortunei]